MKTLHEQIRLFDDVGIHANGALKHASVRDKCDVVAKIGEKSSHLFDFLPEKQNRFGRSGHVGVDGAIYLVESG